MLDTPRRAALHDDIDGRDPGFAAAIADHRATVIEVRALGASAFDLAPGTEARDAVTDRIADLAGMIDLRAGRLGVTTPELLAMINADLLADPPAEPHAPRGRYLRALLADADFAYAQAARTRVELERARDRLAAAAAAKHAADTACAGYVAGWPDRARGFGEGLAA